MTLGLTQPLKKMSTRNIFWGKGSWCVGLTTLPPSYASPEKEEKYSSVLSLTSALDGVGGQRRAPAALPPG